MWKGFYDIFCSYTIFTLLLFSLLLLSMLSRSSEFNFCIFLELQSRTNCNRCSLLILFDALDEDFCRSGLKSSITLLNAMVLMGFWRIKKYFCSSIPYIYMLHVFFSYYLVDVSVSHTSFSTAQGILIMSETSSTNLFFKLFSCILILLMISKLFYINLTTFFYFHKEAQTIHFVGAYTDGVISDVTCLNFSVCVTDERCLGIW